MNPSEKQEFPIRFLFTFIRSSGTELRQVGLVFYFGEDATSRKYSGPFMQTSTLNNNNIGKYHGKLCYLNFMRLT